MLDGAAYVTRWQTGGVHQVGPSGSDSRPSCSLLVRRQVSGGSAAAFVILGFWIYLRPWEAATSEGQLATRGEFQLRHLSENLLHHKEAAQIEALQSVPDVGRILHRKLHAQPHREGFEHLPGLHHSDGAVESRKAHKEGHKEGHKEVKGEGHEEEKGEEEEGEEEGREQEGGEHEGGEHEGGEHGGGEHGGGEHGEEEVTPVRLTVALLLFGFLVFDIALLYLVNYNDANVRSYIYKMISTTISIFCAVLLNQAIFSFAFDQILSSPFPRGLNMKVTDVHRLVVGLLVFFASFTSVNVFSFKAKGNKNHLYAIQVIGGHITAFAGITTFGNLQQIFDQNVTYSTLVVVIASLVLLLCRFVSNTCRESMREKEEKGTEKPSPERTSEEGEWRECVCEAEDDATSLILSFLTAQAVTFWSTGKLQRLHGGADENHDSGDVKWMFLIFCIFLVLLVASTYGRAIIQPHDIKTQDPTSWYMRTVTGLQNFQAMSMSWCLLRIGNWMMSTYVQEHDMVRVANAFVMSAISVVAVIILDKFADKFEEDSNSNDNCRRMATKAKTKHLSDFLDINELTRLVQVDLAKQAQSTTNLERALRTVISGFGLLVGICWERAFDVADETIIQGSEFTRTHMVISRILTAALNALIVIPAWKRFIVPLAQKPFHEHQDMMNLERVQEENDAVQALVNFCTSARQLEDTQIIQALQMICKGRKNDNLRNTLNAAGLGEANCDENGTLLSQR